MTVAEARVLKYEVPEPTATGRSFIDLPADTDLLSVGLQSDKLVVWARVDPEAPEGMHRLIVANTGMEIPGFPEGARFLGTVMTSNGVVWHVWDGDAETTA